MLVDAKKETLIKIKKMIQIGNLVINEKEFNSIDLDNVYKKLSKLDSKYLSEVIIDLSEKLYNLQKINSVFHAEIMPNKKSIGGVTVDI